MGRKFEPDAKERDIDGAPVLGTVILFASEAHRDVRITLGQVDVLEQKVPLLALLRAPPHRDRTKRRMAITQNAASRSPITAHRDHPEKVT